MSSDGRRRFHVFPNYGGAFPAWIKGCTGLGQRRVGLRPTSSVGTTIAKSRAVPGGPIEDPQATQRKGIDHATSDNSI